MTYKYDVCTYLAHGCCSVNAAAIVATAAAVDYLFSTAEVCLRYHRGFFGQKSAQFKRNRDTRTDGISIFSIRAIQRQRQKQNKECKCERHLHV